jgi:hypothetical protein
MPEGDNLSFNKLHMPEGDNLSFNKLHMSAGITKK